MQGVQSTPLSTSRKPYYYELLGRSCDWIVRCRGCQKLVTTSYLSRNGSCRCGHREVAQVKGLSVLEYLRILLGFLNFPHKKEFLREFGPRFS